MRKRLLMTTVMLLSLLSSISLWADTNGTLTNSISWTLTDEGVLTISGEGEMPDFTSNSSPWYNSENVTSVIITDGITKLGSSTFNMCKKLEKVTFPSTLKTIGHNAFDQCDFSAGITLPEGLETIEGYAFDACSLPSITLPSSLKTLGEDAFSNNFIKSVIIPKSVETIAGTVFFGSNPMEKITVEEGNPKYDSRDNCNAIIETSTNILIEGSNCTVIPKTVTRIANYAFSCCHQLQEITIPESIESLGNGAFSRCEKLKSITFEGTTPPTLGEDVFSGVASDCMIKVPRTAYEAYISTENWSALSENIMASGQRAEYNSDGTIVKLFYDGKPTTEEGWHNVYLEDNFRCSSGGKLIDDIYNVLKISFPAKGITSIEFDESMKNYHPTSCYYMFNEMTNLENIKGLEYLNTETVTDMAFMFNACTKLETLDLSGFDTKNVTTMNSMFGVCENLKHIIVSDKFTTDNLNGTNDMFVNNNYLKNKKNTAGKELANYIDGNFEKKVGTLGGEPLGATGEELTIQELGLADGNDLTITETEPIKIKSGYYGRNVASKWGTLCLPYDIAESDECNAKFYTIKSMNPDAIILEEVSSVAAGTPVIFRLTDATSNVAYIPGNGTLATDPKSSNSLVGTFTTQMVPDNAYFIANDAFRLASDYKKEDGTSGVKVGAYRAYIQPAEGQSLSASTLSIKMGDATAIDNAVFDAIDNGTAEYYDASGKRTDGLHKGLNIVKTGNKTRKIIIK